MISYTPASVLAILTCPVVVKLRSKSSTKYSNRLGMRFHLASPKVLLTTHH
jgi:hypothetical protein